MNTFELDKRGHREGTTAGQHTLVERYEQLAGEHWQPLDRRCCRRATGDAVANAGS